MYCAFANSVADLAPYVARIPFVHKNGFSGIWQNRTRPARVPEACMTNSHPYHLRIYTELQQQRIEPRSILKDDKLLMLQRSACCFMTIYHIVMHSIWIEWFCIPRRPTLLIYLLHYLNRTFQYIKSTVYVSYANQSMSPHIKTIENWNESIMLLFFQFTTYPKNWKLKWEYYVFFNASDRHLFLFYILSLVVYFFAQIFLFYLVFPFFSCTFCCDPRCSGLRWDSCF